MSASTRKRRSLSDDSRQRAKKLDGISLGEMKTDAGIDVKVVYTPEDLKDFDYSRHLGFPGEFPFTRGIYPAMNRSRMFSMRIYSGFGTAEDANARYKFLLSQGQTALNIALDLPTQMGVDSDNPRAEGEVGLVGVAIDTLVDFEILFDGLPLDMMNTFININAIGAVILAMYVAAADKQGISRDKIAGTVMNDILKEYVARGAWIFPVSPAMRLIGDSIEFCMKETPRFNPISISGSHFRAAGANAVQELAFVIADAIAYVEEALERGINADDFASQVTFQAVCARDFFEDIAKFRALRRMWARIIKERFGATKIKAQGVRIAGVGFGSALTAAEPLNNIARVAYQVMAAVFGGVQSVHAPSYDEGYAIPTEEAVQVSLRTMQILAYETNACNTVDPLGGSYFLEELTSKLEDEATKLITEIEKRGGMPACVESGYIQRLVADEAFKWETMVRSGEKIVVGVNKFATKKQQAAMKIHRIDPKVPQRQIERLEQVRCERNNAKVEKALTEIRRVATSNENLIPYFVEAIKAYASVGEITQVLKEIFGEFREPPIF